MRLICPKCSAEYDLADELIPQEGRKVQCEDCDHIWLQEKPKPTQRPPLDPSVAAVLRAEAVREAAARKAEKSAAPTDAYFEDLPENTGQTPKAATPAASVAPAVNKLPAASEKESQPIGTSPISAGNTDALKKAIDRLESQGNVQTPAAFVEPAVDLAADGAVKPKPAPQKPPAQKPNSAQQAQPSSIKALRKKRAFSGAFSFVVVSAMILALLYMNAELIGANVPEAKELLNYYTSQIDQLRAQIDDYALRAALAIAEKIYG